MDRFSDRSSILLASTKWTLDEHLFFQRRFRRRSSILMSKQKMRVKVVKPWPSFFVLLVAKTTPGYAGGPKELIARKGVDNKKTPH